MFVSVIKFCMVLLYKDLYCTSSQVKVWYVRCCFMKRQRTGQALTAALTWEDVYFRAVNCSSGTSESILILLFCIGGL